MSAAQCISCGGTLAPRFDRVSDPQTRESFAIQACSTCGLGHTVPQPEDLGRYYGAEYHGGRHGFTAEWCARRRLRLVEQSAGAPAGRRLLDVGCGDGTFLLAAREAGWQVAGTEMNPTRAREAGLDVAEQVDAIASSGPFDCVTLWHTLEHFRDPVETLRSVRRVLAPSGVAVIAVPNAGGSQARAFGPRWFHLDVPRHLFHFTERALHELLRRTGFAPKRCWHQELEYDVMGWAQSALNTLLPTPNLFFSRVTGRKTSAATGELAANLLLGPALSAAAVPATWAGALLGSGGTLVTAAELAHA